MTNQITLSVYFLRNYRIHSKAEFRAGAYMVTKSYEFKPRFISNLDGILIDRLHMENLSLISSLYLKSHFIISFTARQNNGAYVQSGG